MLLTFNLITVLTSSVTLSSARSEKKILIFALEADIPYTSFMKMLKGNVT